MTLAQKKIHVQKEQNKMPGNKSKHMWLNNISQWIQEYLIRRITSLRKLNWEK